FQFTSDITPVSTNSIMLMAVLSRDGNVSFSSFASTPSATWHEIIDFSANAQDDPSLGVAWADFPNSTAITTYGVNTSSSVASVIGCLVVLTGITDAAGTATLHTASPIFFDEAGVEVGGTGTVDLHTTSPAFFD